MKNGEIVIPGGHDTAHLCNHDAAKQHQRRHLPPDSLAASAPAAGRPS
jgi:hypothetical protein